MLGTSIKSYRLAKACTILCIHLSPSVHDHTCTQTGHECKCAGAVRSSPPNSKHSQHYRTLHVLCDDFVTQQVECTVYNCFQLSRLQRTLSIGGVQSFRGKCVGQTAKPNFPADCPHPQCFTSVGLEKLNESCVLSFRSLRMQNSWTRMIPTTILGRRSVPWPSTHARWSRSKPTNKR